jgi:hypothetical protein
MATAKTTKQPHLSGDFYRALHCFFRHDDTPQESDRAQRVWKWLEWRPELRHACTRPQMDILSAIWKLAKQNETLPSYEAVLQEVQTMEKNDEPLDLLKNEYLPMVPTFKAFDAQDLPSIVKNWTDNYNMLAFRALLQRTNSINLGSVEIDRETLSGYADALKFLMGGLHKGIFYEDQVATDNAQFAPKDETIELFTGHTLGCDFSIMGVNATSIVAELVKWLWPERIPLGKMTLFAGKPDCGKSTAMFDIVARVTTGRDWPDGSKNTLGPRSALLAIAEDDLADTVIPRLMAAGGDLSRIKFVQHVKVRDYAAEDSSPETRQLALATDVEKIKMMIEADPEIALVVVDTITSYFGDVNTNADKDVRPVMDELAKAFRDCKACFLGIIHQNKRSDVDAVQKILGAASVAGAVRAAWGFSRDPEDKTVFYMSRIKNNLSKKRSGLKYEIGEKELKDGMTAPCILWGEEMEDDANEMLEKEKDAASNRKDNRQSTMAEALIIAAVANGPRESDSIYAEAMAEGVSGYAVKKTLTNLKKAGRLFHYQRDRVHYWSKDVPELKLEAEELM